MGRSDPPQGSWRRTEALPEITMTIPNQPVRLDPLEPALRPHDSPKQGPTCQQRRVPGSDKPSSDASCELPTISEASQQSVDVAGRQQSRHIECSRTWSRMWRSRDRNWPGFRGGFKPRQTISDARGGARRHPPGLRNHSERSYRCTSAKRYPRCLRALVRSKTLSPTSLNTGTRQQALTHAKGSAGLD